MIDNFKKEVGRRLYNARKEKGYSRAKVGELVGLHETTVKRYEDGLIKALDIERLKSFAEVLGTSASELIGWESHETPSDSMLESMINLREDIDSGRQDAVNHMIQSFGYEHETSRLFHNQESDKAVYIYYKALEMNAAVVLSCIVGMVDNMPYEDMEQLARVIDAYQRADGPIRNIIDTALKPYQKRLFSWDSIDAEE